MSGFSGSAVAGLTIYFVVFAFVCMLMSLVTRLMFNGAVLVTVTIVLAMALLLLVVAATTPIVDFRLGVVLSYLIPFGIVAAAGWLALMRMGGARG